MEREELAPLLVALRGAGHELERFAWRPGRIGELVRFETWIAGGEVTLLLSPWRWWEEPSAWVAALRRRLEQAPDAVRERVLIVDLGGPRPEQGPGVLGRLECFRLTPREWTRLLERLGEWTGAPRPQVDETRALPLPNSPPAQPELVERLRESVEHARAQGHGIVWVRGAIDSGKSQLLADWLAQSGSGLRPLVHRAQAGLEWTSEVEVLWRRLNRALAGLGHASAELEDGQGHARVAEAVHAYGRSVEGREAPIVLLIDGYGHMRAAGEAIEELLVVARSGFGLVLVLASRKLPSALAPASLPDINLDLDRPVDQALALAPAGGGPEELGPSLEGDPERLPALDEAHEWELERSWCRMLARAGEAIDRLEHTLALLCVCEGAVPRALWRQLPDPESRAIALDWAAEWILDGPEGPGLWPPSVRTFLAGELDLHEPSLRWQLVDALALAQRELGAPAEGEAPSAEQEALAAFAAVQGKRLRVELGGGYEGIGWLKEGELVMALARSGELEHRLERALPELDGASARVGLQVLAGVRRWPEIASQVQLQTLLWTELASRGWTAEQLRAVFPWAAPTLALHNQLRRVDHSERVLHGFPDEIRGCAIDAAGRRAVAVSSEGRMWVWSLKTGRVEGRYELDGWAECCKLIDQGRRVVVTSNKGVECWDLDRGERIEAQEQHGAWTTGLAVTPSGHCVLSGDREGRVILWRRDQGRHHALGSHDSRVLHCAISSDGTRGMSCDGGDTAYVWDLEDMRRMHALSGHNYRIIAVAIDGVARRGLTVCVGEVRVWDLDSGKQLAMHDGPGMSCVGIEVVANDTQVIAVESSERVQRWNLHSGRLLGCHLAHGTEQSGLGVCEDGERYLTSGKDRKLRLWRAMGVAQLEPEGFVMETNCVCAGAGGESFWASVGGQLPGSFALDGNTPRVELRGDTGHRSVVARGTRVALAHGQHRVEVYDAASGEQRARWEVGDEWLRAIAVSPGGNQLVYVGDEKRVYISDWKGGSLRSFEGHEGWIYAVEWAPDGRIYSAGYEELRAWDPQIGSCVLRYDAPAGGNLRALASIEKGAKIFCGGRELELIDTAKGKRLRLLEGHEDEVWGLALAREQSLLISASRDASVRVWSVASGKELARVELSYPLTCVCVAGGRIVAGDSVGNLAVFDVDWAALELAARGG